MPMSTIALGSALTVLTLSSLALPGCGGLVRHEEKRVLSVAHIRASPLHVIARNGSVRAEAGETEDVRIHATLHSKDPARLAAVVRAERQADGALKIWAEWPEPGPDGEDGVSFEISLPDAIGVTVGTSNGAVRLSGLGGPAVVRTSNASVTVDGHDGPLEATTSNGAIRVDGVEGPVSASTSNGSVTVRAAGVPGWPVRVLTSNGSVELVLSPWYDGGLRVSTSNGRIDFDGPASAVLNRDDGRAEFRFGGGDGASTVATTNGSVRVRRAEPSQP